MKNRKKILIWSLVCFLGVFCIVSFIYIGHMAKRENSMSKQIKIYYYDKINNNLNFEERLVSIDEKDFVNQIFTQLKVMPKSTNFKSIVPKDLEILSSYLQNEVLTVNFSKDYKSMTDSEKIVLRAGFVWTITQIPSIKNINFLVENEAILSSDSSPIGYLNRNNIIINPVISPDKIEKEKIVLYFANDENYLVEEDRNIEAKQNKSLEMQIVEQLIKGPSVDTHKRTLPTETKIRNIKTEDNICYVDLSAEFIEKRFQNETLDIICIYSIVNSLTELEYINKVQFLIEGEKINYYGKLDISKPLGRDISLIIQ